MEGVICRYLGESWGDYGVEIQPSAMLLLVSDAGYQ